jgi:membrane-bound ClpP family serine protease
MSWGDFYLICLVAGVVFSILAFLGGSFRLPHIHIHLGHGHIPQAGGHARGWGPVNLATVAVFLAWFGGTGYLLSRVPSVWVLIGLLLAGISGLAGASILFFFVARVLIRSDEVLDPADYEMVGVLGKVSSEIRPAGTGEMIFSQAGTRRAAAARSEDGREIARDTEVVVTRYDRGIAWVRRWDELTDFKGSEKEGV